MACTHGALAEVVLKLVELGHQRVRRGDRLQRAGAVGDGDADVVDARQGLRGGVDDGGKGRLEAARLVDLAGDSDEGLADVWPERHPDPVRVMRKTDERLWHKTRRLRDSVERHCSPHSAHRTPGPTCGPAVVITPAGS
jgi:hypothetical protein